MIGLEGVETNEDLMQSKVASRALLLRWFLYPNSKY